MAKIDFKVENHGSLFLFRARNERLQAELDALVVEGQFLGNALAVEPRYAADLVTGLIENGYRVA